MESTSFTPPPSGADAAAADGESLRPAPGSGADTSVARLAPAQEVQNLLGSALPRLWRYALAQPGTSGSIKRQRGKLRELIRWVLVKRGYKVASGVETPYEVEGRVVRGRLELLIESESTGVLLALESDWSDNTESLLKLSVWRRRGVATIWIVGSRCERKALFELRRIANRALREDTSLWLPIFHLEHGWLRVRPSGTHR